MLLKQLSAAPSGCQVWSHCVLAAHGRRFAYIGTLSVHVFAAGTDGVFALEKVLHGADEVMGCVCWSPKDANLLAVTVADHLVVWDVDAGVEAHRIQVKGIYSVDWAAHSPHVIAAGVRQSGQGQIQLIDLRTGASEVVHSAVGTPITLRWHHVMPYLATGLASGTRRSRMRLGTSGSNSADGASARATHHALAPVHRTRRSGHPPLQHGRRRPAWHVRAVAAEHARQGRGHRPALGPALRVLPALRVCRGRDPASRRAQRQGTDPARLRRARQAAARALLPRLAARRAWRLCLAQLALCDSAPLEREPPHARRQRASRPLRRQRVPRDVLLARRLAPRPRLIPLGGGGRV